MIKNIFISLISLLIGFGIGCLFFSSQWKFMTSDGEVSQPVLTFPVLPEVQAITKEEITQIINKFEQYNKQKDSSHIMTLFTPPENPTDSKEYIYLTGLDFSTPMFRPYSLANFNFQLDSFEIISISPENDPPTAEVQEKRSGWDNRNDKWIPLSTKNRIFEFRKIEDNILVDRYFVNDQQEKDTGSKKYNGFYN